jgi:hypothetical protein
MLHVPRIFGKQQPVVFASLLVLSACTPGSTFQVTGPPGKSAAQVQAEVSMCNRIMADVHSSDPADFLGCITASGDTARSSSGAVYAPVRTTNVPSVAPVARQASVIPSQHPQGEPSPSYAPPSRSSPILTAVHGQTYGCVDNSKNSTMVTIDEGRKAVRMSARTGLYVCAIIAVDGVVGPFSNEDSCDVPLVGATMAETQVRQSVRFEGDAVTFGGVVINPPIGMTDEERNQFSRFKEPLIKSP